MPPTIQMANDSPFVYRPNVQFLVVLIVTFQLPSLSLKPSYLVFWYCCFRRTDKASKQWMSITWRTGKFRVELYRNKPRMLRNFNSFDQVLNW